VPEQKSRYIKVRLDSKNYNLLRNLTAQKGESISYYVRKLILNEIRNESALNAQDALTAAVRKAINLELKTTENRLANLAAKGAITAATAENLVYLVLKNQNQQNPQLARGLARKRAVAYLRENLDQLLELYDQADIEGDIQ